MTDITGVPAFGGGGFAARQIPDQPVPAVPEVAKSATDGSATSTRDETSRGQNGSNTNADREKPQNDAAYAPSARHDENIIAGPTPAFQASVLEVESDLKNVIAKVEAKRTQLADEAAIAPSPAPSGKSADTDTRMGATSSPDAPTEARTRDVNESALSAETSAPKAETAPPQAKPTGSATAPTETVDPETAHAGPAASQSTPYDPQS